MSIFDIEQGTIAINSNCHGEIYDDGFKLLAKKFPDIVKEYARHCRRYFPASLLGTYQIIEVSPTLNVAILYGRYTSHDYNEAALQQALKRLQMNYRNIYYVVSDDDTVSHNIEGINIVSKEGVL